MQPFETDSGEKVNNLRNWICAACLLFAGVAGAGTAPADPFAEEPTSPQPHVDCYWDGTQWVCRRPSIS